LFQFDAEAAHDFTLKSLKLAEKTGALSLYPTSTICQPREVMGITFLDAVGLAARLDKNGTVIDGIVML